MSARDGIWLFLDSSSVGGIETHVMQLASGLATMGIQTRLVLYKAYPDSPIPQLFKQLEERNNGNALGTLILDGKPGDLYQALGRYRPPALIHTHGYKAGIIVPSVGVGCSVTTYKLQVTSYELEVTSYQRAGISVPSVGVGCSTPAL